MITTGYSAEQLEIIQNIALEFAFGDPISEGLSGMDPPEEE